MRAVNKITLDLIKEKFNLTKGTYSLLIVLPKEKQNTNWFNNSGECIYLKRNIN